MAGDELTDEQKAAKAAEEAAAAATPDAAKAAEEAAAAAAKDKPVGSDTGFTPPTNDEAQAFFMKVMTPIKANGKMIQLKSPDEAIQLMQMGANYTRKMQELAPHRKVLAMLQNNELLDEGKLSFLIDLDKRNPEAIKKLVKDAGIDPMDIDTSAESTYLPGDHVVTDEEASFKTALEDLSVTDAGKETLRTINTTWDPTSKEVLWKSPELMAIFHAQRESGIYALITEEIDRRRVLGTILPTTPFLQAYKTVGDEMAAADTFTSTDAKLGADDDGKLAGQPEPEVVATRTAAPKSPVVNSEQANAASPTRTTPRKAEPKVNVLAMSDEEFMKLDQFTGRV